MGGGAALPLCWGLWDVGSRGSCPCIGCQGRVGLPCLLRDLACYICFTSASPAFPSAGDDREVFFTLGPRFRGVSLWGVLTVLV